MVKVTYQKLYKVLNELGFTQAPTTGSHVLFRHRPTSTVIALPPGAKTKVVPAANLAAVRMTIIGREIARQDDVDQLFKHTRRQTA